MREKVINPDSITLDDVMKMDQKQWRIYTFMKLNKLDHCVGKIESRLWWVLGSVVVFGVVAILTAVA